MLARGTRIPVFELESSLLEANQLATRQQPDGIFSFSSIKSANINNSTHDEFQWPMNLFM